MDRSRLASWENIFHLTTHNLGNRSSHQTRACLMSLHSGTLQLVSSFESILDKECFICSCRERSLGQTVTVSSAKRWKISLESEDLRFIEMDLKTAGNPCSR
uniref:Uncharacterized protein n=1 Tax=Compsopogon caeruleus TaxID=31354 RepID=A0A7S1XH04_9RHOD|mmetsp:Transcript_7414/g.15123  ORF Transcript_7414/g.15123 Transcript_7414/m.15123 type:complete len:102 (+) Transcript_7414:210-515(+)